MSYGFHTYVSVEQKKAKAKRMLKKLLKTDPTLSPIPEGVKLGQTWWGKAWNKNLERYADYANRIDRGKSYVRNGFVLGLVIEKGVVRALVAGSSSNPYNVIINITPLSNEKITEFEKLLSNRPDTLEDLIQGKFPKAYGEQLLDNLFPKPREIKFGCTCPDSAYMCKHVAAVLYGIGSKIDLDPMLFFTLRNIDTKKLIKASIEAKTEAMLANAKKDSERELSQEEELKLFGL